MCERFHALPVAGGILDQPASFIKQMKIYHLGSRERQSAE